jgi:GTPase
MDMVDADKRVTLVRDFVKRMRSKTSVFEISALTREGLGPLLKAIYKHVAASKNTTSAPIDPRFDDVPEAETATETTRD